MNSQRRQQLEKIMSSIGEIQRGFATSRDSFLANYQISRAQVELLFAIKKTPSATSVLAKQFSVSSSAISQMVDQLVAKELVTRTPDANDRRIVLIQLSEHGKQLFNTVRAQFIDHLGERFQSVSDDELGHLYRVVSDVAAQIQEDMKPSIKGDRSGKN